MSIKLEVWGDYALFSRPEFSVERVTYDVMTPSAARGILEAIYWHPGMRWIIDKIYVLSQIKFTNVRRNEVKSKVNVRNVEKAMLDKTVGGLYINTKTDIQQRAALILKDVHYVIEAHFEITANANKTDNPGKFQDIIRRRIIKGQCFHEPYFGCREFPVKFRLYEFDSITTAISEECKDLGYMLYDMDYSNPKDIKPMFFRAELKRGVLDLSNCEVLK